MKQFSRVQELEKGNKKLRDQSFGDKLDFRKLENKRMK